MIYIYPAIFSHCEVEERGTVYTVEIPDIPGCITEGESIQGAMAMGREALAGCILALKQEQEAIPEPSNYKDITTQSPDDFITLLDVDLNEYLRKRETKSVIKTVSLPQWLAIMAEESGISYSQTLQQALKQHLGIQD